MAIDRTKLKQIHNLLAQNGFAQDYSTFEKKFAGNANYGNRKKVYDLITENGGDIGGSYEDFMKRLQSKPKPKQQPSKPQTTAQRAMQIGGRQLPKPKNVPSNASPFVKSLYAKDLMERGEQQPTDYVSKREDYTSPKAVQNMSRRSQKAGRVAAKNAAAEIDEQYMQSQPVMNTGTPADEYVGKTERQLEKQIADSGADLVNSDNSDKSWIDDMVNNEIFVKAQQRADKAYSEGNWHINPADDQMDELFHTRKSNAEFDQGKMIKSLEETLKTKASEWLSRPETIKKIQGEAQRLGIDVDTYISRSVVPALYNKVSSRLAEKNLDRYMPRSSFDYILGGITEGLTATLGEFANNETKSQKELRKQAVQLTREGKNPHFKPNTWDNAGRGGVAFMSDMPWYTLSGLGATAATEKLFGSAAKQMAVRASQNLAQRVLGDVAKGAVHGYLTGFQFGFVNGAVQNFSTGEDTSLGGTLKAALKGASEEGASFAVMEGMGGLSGALGYKIGLKGTEKGFLQASKRAVQKVGYETVKTGLEGLGMASGGVASSYANHLLTGEDWHGFTKEGTLESCASAVIFKLTHAKEIFKGEKGKDGKRLNFMDGVAQKTSRFFMSDEAKLAPHVFTEDEKAQLFNAGSNIGMKPMDNIISFAKQAKKKKYDVGDDPYKDTDIELIGNAYDQIMADPKVSWDAKAKFTTLVMGTMPESRPMMDYCTFTTEKVGGDDAGVKKYINEYSADGTLLSKTSYDNTDKREQALYKMAMTREGQRLWNVMGTLVGIDKNNYDYQNAFFTERVKDAKDGAEIQAFVDGMGTKGSAVEQEFTNWVLNNGSTMKAIDAFARESGMKKEDIVKLMNKDPLHRTEEEQLLCVKLRRELEKQAFPADKVHEEQSNLEGKDVADDNSLGTEEPNTEAVTEQLDNLSKAEEGVETLMRDNDVFGDNFKKMQDEGMTNPQIYDWMIRNGGMTQEQLKPFADYINANARVQGMQQRTQQKIEEVVGKVVHDWSYRGTMNGAKSDGEQVLYVEDRDGRRLMVGSGDVAFDSVTGRAKEDVGDMLVCLDPETKEMVYIKAEDAKFVGAQKPEDFANEYRQKLQEINSQPYNEAMQRQAERDASKEETSTSNSSDKHLAEHSNDESDHLPTQENDIPSVEKDTNNSSNSNGNEGILTHSDADYEKNDIPADKDGEPVYEQVPKERTVEDLFGKLGGDGNLAHSFAEAKVAEAEKEQQALLKKEPKMGTKINEYLKKKREHEDAVKAAEAKVAYWNDVKGEIEKLTHTTLDEMKEQQAELDGTAAAAEHKALYGEGQPADGTALAAKFVADAKITPDSFKKETGFGTAEQAGFVGMIAKEENGGKSIERLAEDLVYYDNTEYNGTYFRNDTNEARNAIISALGAARTRKGLRELAQPDLAKFESERAQERDNAYHEAYGMDYEEYLAYSEQEMPHILEKINNFDEEKYLHDKAEEITNQIDKEYGKAIRRDESAGEEPVHGEGDKVLPGTRTDERGGGESPEGHAGRTEAERRSDTENAALPEEASAGAGRVEAEQQKEVDEAVKHVATEITKQTGIDVVTDERKGQSALEDAEATDSDVKFHKETDKETLDKLNNGETVKVYRAMQVIDGKLYPPMAASVGGKLVEANELGQWIRADENPDLAIPDMDSKTGKQKVDKKTGELKWKFKLDKGGKDATGKKATDVNAAYNPYWHMSRSPLNDQFKSAWIRPNIVVVECEVPASELSSGYKAERAKDAVGEVDWKSGSVSGEVFKQTGRARKVILSRWCKPVRVLDDAEVAQRAKEFVGDAKVEIPENVLTPKQRIAFEKAGFKIGGPEKGVKKSEQIMDALERGLQIDNSLKETSLETVAPPTSRDNASVVPSDSVAKIQNNLDSTKELYKKTPNKTRGFITDVSKALGLKQHEASQYGAFQTEDGREFTIRISNHNAKVSLFDKNGEQEGISIVISGLRNKGLLNDGNAHVVEVFYPKKAIEHAEGKPLVDIIDSIKETLKTGVYEDKTGLGKKQEVNSLREFRTKDGEIYGFTVDGKIYLDTKKMKPETPLHEYTHLWSEALKKKNPKEWENVKKLFDDVEGLKEEVQKLYPELEGDALYDEMIATYSGREGTKKLEAVVRELAAKNGSGVAESVKEQGFIYKVKEALQRYWKGVADMLHIHFTTAEEVADKVLADWAKGVKPGEVKEPIPILPKSEKPDQKYNPIEYAAAEFKKEHPMTEEEILKCDADDVVKDMALDYLNGEVTDDLHRAIYESLYAQSKGNKTVPKVEGTKPQPKTKVKEVQTEPKPQKPVETAKTEDTKVDVRKADDAAVAASNKKVNDLWAELRKAGRDEMAASLVGLTPRQLEVLPKLVGAMAENAYLRIKRGMHNLDEMVKEMRKEFAPAAKYFDKENVDAIYEQMMNIRYRDGEQRMSLKDWADYYEKTSPAHKENLVGDSKEAEYRKQSEKKFIDRINTKLAFGDKLKGIVQLRKIAEECGLKDIKDTDLQELVETAIVQRARGIATSESTNDAKKFERIKKLYENQPSLNQRDSERVQKQQYSTPAPYAFVADMWLKGNGKEVKSALEPSAGNGMLTIGLPMDAVHVNDIDAQRLANLRRQGFKNVTSQDGTQPFADKDVDVVITNPPFGSATPKEYDGYTISSLEGQMAINALESMKDDGRAAIIIGGKTEYAKNGSLKPKDKAFLGYLYSHYNVEDVINVDGGLYAKQGTSYPTRLILINGRRLNENAFPPVKDKARAETVKDYDELYKRIEDDILRSERMDSSIGGEKGSTRPELDKQGSADTHEEGLRTRERGGSEPDGKRESDVSDASSVRVPSNELGKERGTEPRKDGGLSDGDTGADGTGAEPSPSKEPTTGTNKQRGNGSGGVGRSNAQSDADGTSESGSGRGPRGQLQRVDRPLRGLSSEKVSYTPKSENPFTLQSVMPADQQDAVNKNLEKLGDADQFLVDELGYNDKDDLYSHLAAEQVDSVALALQQAKKGKAFIIGDMTGIGKGRQAASLIRYAKKQGQVPVYFTKTAGLLSDVYRDLVDIGSPELRPFVFGSAKEAAITDSDGNEVFALPSKSEVKRVLDYIEKNGKLPDEYDYVLTTYSQVSNGVYEFDENGARKEKKLAKGKTFGSAALSGQRRRDAIEKLMDNAYLILDESHTAGGNSGQGNYFQHIIQKAKNVTFFSATFAKRPDNMPIYALRTAMNEGGMKSSDLIEAVKRGGATLQEIMSQTLTQCGQMIRRERDMTGVTIDWKAIDDPERVQEQREQYDSIIGLFNDIISFQKKYVSAYVDKRNEELAEVQSSLGIKRGTAALGIKNQPFASKAFNTVQQVLLSLKAKSAAERAIDYLKQGMKPVIALNNTNESQTGNLALGEEMDAPDLGTSLKKGLEGTLRYTRKDAKDNSESGYLKLEDLGEEAVVAYHELEKKIEQTSTGLSLSPIDVIKNELEKAGYKVGELTGRQTEFVYNDNGSVTKMKRADTDKKKLARDFNDGKIDALILNKSAATGISLHASSKYKDQRKRVMIVAQQQLDVNDEVQMRGRIDRTGQVARGAYEYVVSLIPAEQRLLMMFKAKLKSLDANTTSSQKSKFNEMEVADITNKYGDKVVREYMAEHLDLYSKMADPFNWEKSYGEELSSIDPQKLVATGNAADGEAGGDASKLLGRMALLRVSEQEKMLQEIGELYANEIQRLNEMGENDLEITELPLKAKTISKEVWKEGAEPGGDNAFADNTYIEKVNMAILKKPMKAEEVKKSQKGLTGGKSWEEYKTEKEAAVKEYFDQRIAAETQKNEERAVKAATKAKEKYQKDAKKGQNNSGMSDEQIEKMSGFQYDSVYKQEKEKLDDVVKNLRAKAEMFERVLETFNTDEAYVLPTDMSNPSEISGFGNSYGRLIDIKTTDNFSPNASTVSFATLDGRRKITFPVVGKVGSGDSRVDIISSIDRMTKQASSMGDKYLKVLNMDANNWDHLVSNESRKDGYIITGNLMQALIDTKAQGVGGQLVKYTTDGGEVKTGILMPDRFEPSGLSNEYPISKVESKFKLPTTKGGIDEITSSDGEVRITQKYDYIMGRMEYELRVPKSKAKGGKYYLDKDLLGMVSGGNFDSRGNSMMAEFRDDKLGAVLSRLSNLGVKVREERNGDEQDGVHFRIKDNKTEKQNNSVATISEDAPVVVKHVDRVSKETGVKVNMVQSAEEVSSPRVKKALEDGGQVTGWYDEKTGEVHLYMPNIHDRYTAEKTIWHETVGHKGMRGLMGEQFDRFLRDVWYDLDKPENAELKKLVDEERRRNPLNIYNAIEEGIARLAEEGRGEPGFWRNIRNKVTDFFREIGYRIAPNTKDVKYLLWLSKNLQKNPNDVFYKMRAEAVRWRLDHETVPDVIEANGMFFDNDGKAHKSYLDMSKEEYEEATDGEIHLRTTPSAGTAIDRYHRALNEHGYMFTESYMDNMLSLQKLMLAIKPGMKIEDIKSSENPYMLQNTMQGKMSTMAQKFNDDVMEPLNKVMAKSLDAFDGKNQTEKTRSFNLYMIAKHGLERNRVFFVRDYIRDLEPSDAEILQRQWDAEKKDLGDKLRNGQIDLKEYYKTMDEWIRNNVDMDYKADEHDYSGFHGLQEIDDKKAPYDDAEAIQSVMDSEAKMEDIKNGSVADLWSKINTATRYSLDLEYDGSMLTKENHDHVSEMFDWYVPLRKYDEATAEDMYGYVSENGDASTYIGPALMKAKGRKSLSNVNIIAQIGAMGNMSISRYGNNAVKMAFARFVRSNGGQGLVTETNLWVEKKGVDNNGKPIWEEAYPKIPENATADEISKIVSDFETDMKAKQAKGEARNLSTRGHVGFKFERAKDRDQHFVDVMIAGKTHRFVVNGNPRAAQALNGLLEHKAGGVGRVFATISRFMAQTCTSYNPEFVMRNMIRDFEFASSNLLAKEGLKYTKVFEKYYAKVGLIEGIRNSKIKDLADTGGFGLYAKYRNGTLDTSNKIQGYFKEFMDNGGETGWVQVKNMKDLSKEYRRNIKTERSKVAKVGKGFYNLIFKNLENVNEIAENMARFATYCASRDSGRSVVRSAYDAKEVSTNFNRHGSASAIKSFKNGEMSGMQNARKQIYRFTSSYFRNTSMFFNAGIQSTNLLIKNFKHNPIGTAGYIAAGPMITAGLMALLNNVMIASEDEKDRKGVKDPYGELPDYIRRNNLCVYIGEGEFVTIPLAIEERAFYGLGDFVAGMTFADNISSQKMANLAENKKVDKWLNPAMDAVGCLSQLVPVMDYLGHASFGKEPVQETVKGFAPSAISPIVEWLYNSDWKGSPIQRDDKFDEEQPSWMLAYKGTPDFLVDINKKVNAATNTVAPGNENMKGNDFWDAVTNPSALQHFYSGYMGGAATFAERAVGLVKKGKDVETKDIPFVRSLLYTPNEQSSLQRTKTKWYNYQDEMAKTMSNVKRLKSKNVPADQLLRNYSDYFKFQDSKEAMKVQVIEEADKMIKEWKKLRNKSSDTESINYANHNIEMIMQEAVDKLDKLSE